METSPAERASFISRFYGLAALLAAIWIISVVNFAFGGSFNSYGILPRSVGGLPGIIVSPFLHGDLWHLLSNTMPMILLGGMVALRGHGNFWGVTVVVAVVGGLGVWLVGRGSFHIGASGLVFGYFGYLVGLGWFERKLLSIVTAIVTLILYSGLIWGVLPLRSWVSWEGHLFGMVAGILIAYFEAKGSKSETA